MANPKEEAKNNDFFSKRLSKKLQKFHEHLNRNNVVLFMLAKKLAGKGTYAKILHDLSGGKIKHISVGDLVREAEKKTEDDKARKELMLDIRKYYKGQEKLEDVINIFAKEAKDTSTLLPTEVVMALIEKAVKDNQGKSVIIDGFPRSKEQVALALKMQKDFEAQNIPSVFVEINCPEDILIKRSIDRRVCPMCQTSRNIKLLLTKEIEFDEKTGEFHLICERPACDRARFVKKQGDQDGIEKIKERQKKVQDMIDEIKNQSPHLHLSVHNAILLDEAYKHDPADFTEEAELFWDKDKKEVIRSFKPMVSTDEHGRKVYSRWPEPVVVDMVDKLVDWLDSRK